MGVILNSLFVIILCGALCSADQTCSNRIASVKNKVGEKCLKQLTKLCDRSDLLLTFWDSSSRQLHSGLLATNNEDLGNYDLCMSIDDDDIRGKFCPFQWATKVSKHLLEEAVSKGEEYNHLLGYELKENHTFGNVVKYGVGQDENITLIGSVCISDACSPEEFTSVFNPYVYPVTYSVRDASKNCVTKDATSNLSTSELVITICICLIFGIVIGCTAFHIWLKLSETGEPHDLVKAFSVLHNGKKLIKTSKNNPEQVQCIHGMRFLSMLWVVAGHTFASGEILPHFNDKDVRQWRSHLYAQYILAGPYAVDTFFFLSGLLLAYGYLKQMENVPPKKQISAIPLMILHRYLRLTPAIAALFFVSISFLKTLGNGPLWLSMVESINQPCKQYWWRYFFYIQNYASSICYTQTWYLSADMQMFLASPLVLIPAVLYYRKRLRLVISSLIALIVFCVSVTIAILYLVDGYSNDYDTHSRLSDYLVGIIGGIILHAFKGKAVKMKKIVRIILWIVVLSVMLFLILYLNDVLINPTKDKKNLFNPIQRPIWTACLLWIVFACHHGYGGIVNDFLSCSFFQIGSKLSYCMFCIHGTVILYNLGTTRYYLYFNDYSVLYILCGNMVACFIISTIWTLTFESPMIILNKMILGKLGSPKK